MLVSLHNQILPSPSRDPPPLLVFPRCLINSFQQCKKVSATSKINVDRRLRVNYFCRNLLKKNLYDMGVFRNHPSYQPLVWYWGLGLINVIKKKTHVIISMKSMHKCRSYALNGWLVGCSGFKGLLG